MVADDSNISPPEEQRVLNTWKKPVYRMAVICVEFEDVKHDPKVSQEEWDKMFFSKGTYNNVNATGQKVFGSMADYYAEASCGRLRLEGNGGCPGVRRRPRGTSW